MCATRAIDGGEPIGQPQALDLVLVCLGSGFGLVECSATLEQGVLPPKLIDAIRIGSRPLRTYRQEQELVATPGAGRVPRPSYAEAPILDVIRRLVAPDGIAQGSLSPAGADKGVVNPSASAESVRPGKNGRDGRNLGEKLEPVHDPGQQRMRAFGGADVTGGRCQALDGLDNPAYPAHTG